MKTTVKFLYSTLVAAAAMTSTAWAEGTTLIVDSSGAENTFASVRDALTEANNLGGATINIVSAENDGITDGFALTNAGAYTITGGDWKVFTPVLVNGKDVALNFDGAFVTLGKLRGGKDNSNTYQKNAVNITNSVIASTDYAGYGGGWATFYDCSVTINNSIYACNLSKYATDTVKTLPRSASAVKAAIAEGTYTLAEGSGYNGQHIGTSGFLDIDDSTVYSGFISIADRGYADIDNSVVYVCGSLGIGDGKIANGGNDSNNNGWTASSASDYRTGELATMDVTDSIVRNITLNGEGGGLQVGSASKGGVLNITRSEFDFTRTGESSEKVAVYANGTINIVDSTFSAGSITNNGTINISGNSQIVAASYSGNAIKIVGDTTLTDSLIGGNVAVGYGNYTKQPATLTLKGTSSISGVLYVGDEKTVDAYKLNVNGSATIGSLYSRTESIVNVSEANLSIGYWQNKGKATIDNASVEVTGVNFYVYNNDSDSLASITLKNGATLTAMGLANNIGLILGNTEATPAKGHAALYLEGGSTANLSELQLRPTVNGDKTYKIEVAAKGDSTINVRDAVVIGAGATISLTDSTLKATSVCGEGLILGNGTVNLSADSISTQVFVGGYYDAEGNRQYNDGEALRSKLVLDDVSGNGVMIENKEFRVNNADITLKADVTAELGNKYFYIRESVLNLNGHTVNLNTGKFIANGINITGEGTINATDSNDPACFQNVKATIGSGVTFNTHTFHAYTDLDLHGNASATGTALVGVNGKEPFDSSKPWIDNANMTVWGKFEAGSMTVQGASGNIVASKLIVKDGGNVSVFGKLTNNGVLEVDANGTVTANAITGLGDVVLAGTIKVVGGVFEADELTIVAGAKLNFGAAEKGVTLMATREVISFDFNTLTIIATDVKVGELDLHDVLNKEGADLILSKLTDGTEFKVVDSSTKREFTAVYNAGAEGFQGSISVIPEPSMFGLFAGLGALLLVGTRRRRK